MLKKPLLLLLFVPFLAFSLFVTFRDGYTGFISQVALAGGWNTQVFIDLCLSLLLLFGFIAKDCKTRGVASWPYLLLVMTTGSLGAFVYFLARPRQASSDSASASSSS